jgi:hypothetical protein
VLLELSHLRKSNFVYSSVSSVLYEKVTLNNIQQCLHTLSMLQRRPEIARHVRELVVRPHTNKKIRQGIAVSALASAAVRDAAATMRLDALKKFVWDGEERPYHEDMWFALRMGCVVSGHQIDGLHLTTLLIKVPTTSIHRNIGWGASSLAKQSCRFCLAFFTLNQQRTLQLFDFVNLSGFSLMFRRGFYEMHMDMFLDGASFVLWLADYR